MFNGYKKKIVSWIVFPKLLYTSNWSYHSWKLIQAVVYAIIMNIAVDISKVAGLDNDLTINERI